MTADSEKRDDVLKRLLKTPPKPHKPTGKPENGADEMPTDHDASGKRNIQGKD